MTRQRHRPLTNHQLGKEFGNGYQAFYTSKI